MACFKNVHCLKCTGRIQHILLSCLYRYYSSALLSPQSSRSVCSSEYLQLTVSSGSRFSSSHTVSCNSGYYFTQQWIPNLRYEGRISNVQIHLAYKFYILGKVISIFFLVTVTFCMKGFWDLMDTLCFDLPVWHISSEFCHSLLATYVTWGSNCKWGIK